MKSLFTLLTLLFTLTVGAQNPAPPAGNLPPPPEPHGMPICYTGCFAGCSPISPVCQDKRLDIIEQAIQDAEFDESNIGTNMNFDNSIVNIVESNSFDLNTTHILFKSKVSNETISAVISTTKSSGKNQASSSVTTFNLPKGQIVMGSESIKLITASEVVEISLNEDSFKNDFSEMEHFQKVYNDLVNNSDYLEFSLILSELNSTNKLSSCGSAKLGVALASASLVVAVAAAALSGGGFTPAVIIAHVELAAAIAAKNVACHAF